MKHESFNESAEMYLKTVSELTACEGPVPISAVAHRLGVSAVSATEMVHRLAENGLLNHQPYKGVHLTEVGRKQATSVVRSHRLWERFLTDCLGFGWDEVHELACRLEHATAPQITDALEVFLNYPETCPHGNPIPDQTGTERMVRGIPLMRLAPGQTATITSIHPETEEILVYLAEQGLKPGVCLTMKEIAPFNGPVVFIAGGSIHYLGQIVAAHLFVQPEEA